MYNHYVRLDENFNIIKTFSDAFEKPLLTDIKYKENTNQRHFHLNLFIEDNLCRYEWKNKKYIKKTKQKLNIEKNSYERKIKKYKKIRNHRMQKCMFVMVMAYGEEIAVTEGIITNNNKILKDVLRKKWLEWYKEEQRNPTEQELSIIDIDNINENNIDLFKLLPEYPDDFI